MTLTFIHYCDVWGNETDGWDVNDVRKYHIEGKRSIDVDSDVLKFLKDQDIFFGDVELNQFTLDWDESGVEISMKADQFPVGRLEFL